MISTVFSKENKAFFTYEDKQKILVCKNYSKYFTEQILSNEYNIEKYYGKYGSIQTKLHNGKNKYYNKINNTEKIEENLDSLIVLFDEAYW